LALESTVRLFGNKRAGGAKSLGEEFAGARCRTGR